MKWLAEHHEGGELVYRIGRDGDSLCAEWLGIVTLFATRDGSEHRFVPANGADPRDVTKIVDGSGQLLLRHLEGKLALHGAAVRLPEGAVVLLGESGAGKSTLCASLCSRSNTCFLADDAIALDEHANILPLERNHWLEVDARNALRLGTPDAGKQPVAAAQSALQAAPVVALVELRYSDVSFPRLLRLHGLDALGTLMPQIVRFVIDEPSAQRAELDAAIGILDRIPAFRLERPRRLELLSLATDLVIEMARDAPSFVPSERNPR